MQGDGNRKLWKAAGLLGIGHIVLMLGGFSMERVAPLGSPANTVTADYVSWSTGKGFAGAYVAALSFLVFLAGGTLIARLLRGNTDGSKWLSSVISASAAVYVAVTLATGFADSSAALYGGHHGAPLSVVTAFNNAHWFSVFLATAVLGLFTVSVAVAGRMTDLLPRPIAYAGFAVGALCFAGASPGTWAVGELATMAWMLWFVVLSVTALRRSRAQTSLVSSSHSMA